MVRRLPWTPAAAVLAIMAALVLAEAIPAGAANNGQGQGQFRIRPFVELQTTDGSAGPFTATPTSSDPGPRVWDDADGLRFNARYTNTKHLVFVEVSSATGNAGPTVTVQGTTHAVADWVQARTDQTTRYATVQVTGTSDAAAGSYTVPGGFTQDGQGTVAIRTYHAATPEDGGLATTLHWAYDAGENEYWFDAGDKDFTNGNGEVLVSPATAKGKQIYTFQAAGIIYAVTAVGDAPSGFVPTLTQSWSKEAGKVNGEDFDAFLMLDFPSGSPPDTYAVTLRATIQSVK